MIGLTDRQREILDFIVEHFHATGSVPSYREIQARLGFNSSSGACDHLRALARKGHIHIHEMGAHAQSRSYRILRLSDGTPVVARLVPAEVHAPPAVEGRTPIAAMHPVRRAGAGVQEQRAQS